MGRGRYAKPDSQREAITPRCFICAEFVLYLRDRAGGRFVFRGTERFVCTRCRGRYYEPAIQLQMFAGRFRWIERSEIPTFRQTGGRGDQTLIAMIFMTLLHARERQLLRQKEVNMSTTASTAELARKLRKLPSRIAAIIAQTVAVRGDDYRIDDNQALVRIRDLLEEIDPKIIDRNAKRKLP